MTLVSIQVLTPAPIELRPLANRLTHRLTHRLRAILVALIVVSQVLRAVGLIIRLILLVGVIHRVLLVPALRILRILCDPLAASNIVHPR
jgi:hypothetical protein